MALIDDYTSDLITDEDTLAPSAFMEMADQVQQNQKGRVWVFNRYNAVNALGTKPTLGTAGTNTKIGTISFQDGAVPVESWQPVKVPDDFKEDGDLKLSIHLYSGTANNDALFSYSILGVAAGESIDSAPVFVDTLITLPASANTLLVAEYTIAAAAHGLSRGDLLYFTLKRIGNDGTDTHAAAVLVISCEIEYQIGETD